MATGWAQDGAVQEQIDDTIQDAVTRARNSLPAGESLSHCEDCDAPIPEARQKALPGVWLCVQCQEKYEQEQRYQAAYNRRASKDSQLR